MPPPFEKLDTFMPENCRDIHALNHDEYLAIVSNPIPQTKEFPSEELIIYKYSLEHNDWNEEVMTDKLQPYKCSTFDTKRRILYVMTANKLYTIDTRTWRIIPRYKISSDRMIGSEVRSMLVIGGELHIYGVKNNMVIDISRSWKVIQHRTIKSGIIEKVLHSKSTNSLIAFQHDDNYLSETRLLQCSLETKKWKLLPWSRTSWEIFEGQRGLVIAGDGRYLLCFGAGVSYGVSVDHITYYDLKDNRTRGESGIRVPIMAGYRVVLMGGDQQTNELTVAGYVNKSYKEEEFRNLHAMPLHLIQLVAKWYQNEQICLLARNRKIHYLRYNHWRVKLDDIIKH